MKEDWKEKAYEDYWRKKLDEEYKEKFNRIIEREKEVVDKENKIKENERNLKGQYDRLEHEKSNLSFLTSCMRVNAQKIKDVHSYSIREFIKWKKSNITFW